MNQRRINTFSKLHESAPRQVGVPIGHVLFSIWEEPFGAHTWRYIFRFARVDTGVVDLAFDFSATTVVEADAFSAALLSSFQPVGGPDLLINPGGARWDILLELDNCRNCYGGG